MFPLLYSKMSLLKPPNIKTSLLLRPVTVKNHLIGACSDKWNIVMFAP